MVGAHQLDSFFACPVTRSSSGARARSLLKVIAELTSSVARSWFGAAPLGSAVHLSMLLHLFGIILMIAQALFPTSYSIYLFAQISWLKFVFNYSFKHLKASNHLYPQQMDRNWILNGELGSNAYFGGVLNFMQFQNNKR